MLHKHLECRDTRNYCDTGPSTYGFDRCDNRTILLVVSSKSETASKSRSDVSCIIKRWRFLRQDSSSPFLTAIRPVLSESHMETAINQGSSCHLISYSAFFVRGLDAQSIGQVEWKGKRKLWLRIVLAATMSLFRAYRKGIIAYGV